MRTRARFLAPGPWLLLPMLGLSACATSTGCDPSRAGFLESLNCSSGGFQQRESYLRQGYDASAANAAAQHDRMIREGARASAAQHDLAARRQQLSRLDGRLAELRLRLRGAESRPGADPIAVRRAQDELTALQQRQYNVRRSDPDEVEMREIERRQDEVKRILQDL